jgi:hypothetical protein
VGGVWDFSEMKISSFTTAIGCRRRALRRTAVQSEA